MNQTPKNRAERNCYNSLKEKGWKVYRKGWPDFWCLKNDKLIIVEVKRKKGYRLNKHQYMIMSALAKAGIKCYYWTPQGAEPFSENTPHAKP